MTNEEIAEKVGIDLPPDFNFDPRKNVEDYKAVFNKLSHDQRNVVVERVKKATGMQYHDVIKHNCNRALDIIVALLVLEGS